eukprot:m51a1_g9238 putative sarcoplasmic reticulum histidine-rich calcium-binding protein (138) ;mRNA; f:107824-108329
MKAITAALALAAMLSVASALSLNPCSYCKYCNFCQLCPKCPCTYEACEYCPYCSYCKFCNLCTSVCEGAVAKTLASGWESVAATFGFSAPESAPDVSDIDRVVADEARKARARGQTPIMPGEAAAQPAAEGDKKKEL